MKTEAKSMENLTNWQRLGSSFAGRILQDMNSALSGKRPQCCLRKSSNLLVGNADMKGQSSQRGRSTQRETSPGSISLVFASEPPHCSTRGHSQCWAGPCCGLWCPKCSLQGTPVLWGGSVSTSASSPWPQGDTWLLLLPPSRCRSHCSMKFPVVQIVLGAGSDSTPEMISPTP